MLGAFNDPAGRGNPNGDDDEEAELSDEIEGREGLQERKAMSTVVQLKKWRHLYGKIGKDETGIFENVRKEAMIEKVEVECTAAD